MSEVGAVLNAPLPGSEKSNKIKENCKDRSH